MDWYYAANGQQSGPVPPERLAELWWEGQIDEATLVWRDGLAEWQPFETMRAELPLSPAAPASTAPLRAEESAINPYAAPATTAQIDETPDWSGRGIGAAFKQAFRILTLYPGCLLAAYFVVWIPLNFAVEYYCYEVLAGDVDDPAVLFKQMRVNNVADGFFGIIAVGAVLTICGAAWEGAPIGFWAAFGAGFTNWGRLWLARFVLGICLIFSLLALILPGIWVLVRLSFVDQVAIGERLTGTGAIKRSWELTRGRFWPLLGYLLVGILPVVALGILSGIPMEIDFRLDSWWFSAITSCVIDFGVLFFLIFMFVVYRHYLDGENPDF